MNAVSLEEDCDAEYAARSTLAIKAVAHRNLFWIAHARDYQSIAMTTCHS
jgi:hypothetical protein